MTTLASFMRRFLVGALALTLVIPPVRGMEDLPLPEETEAELMTEEAAEDPSASPVPETTVSVARPDWMLRAEKRFEEGKRALEAGDTRSAARHFRYSLKMLSRKTGSEDLTHLKDEIAAMFGRLEERLAPSVDEDAPEDSLEVTEQELQDVPVNRTDVSVRSARYTIPIDPENPLVKKYIAIYTGKRRKEMQAALDRMAEYKPMIVRKIREAGMPRELLYLPIAESEFKNTVTSHAGAVGLWQFMSGTARRFGLKVNYWEDERRDPEKATTAALQYLKELHGWFADWHLALASYNRGEHGIQRDMKFTRSLDFTLLSERHAIPRETEHYVPKFMACVLIADNAASYGFKIPESKPIAFDVVELDRPMDVAVAAECAGVSESDIRELNPTLRLWCTPKDRNPFPLKIPAGTKDRFLAKAQTVKEWTPGAGVVKYRVKRGDFLGNIARRYRTSVSSIQQDNRIRDPKFLRPGQVLVIRPGKSYRGDD
jgi:membrane-bound lytic murein transglycosylase D